MKAKTEEKQFNQRTLQSSSRRIRLPSDDDSLEVIRETLPTNPESVAEQHEKDRPARSRAACGFSWIVTRQLIIQSNSVTRASRLRKVTTVMVVRL